MSFGANATKQNCKRQDCRNLDINSSPNNLAFKRDRLEYVGEAVKYKCYGTLQLPKSNSEQME